MNRRDSIQKFVLGGTVLFLAPSVLKSCSKDSTTDPGGGNTPPAGNNVTVDLALADNASLNTSGGSKIIKNVIVVNTGSGYIALSSVCTHQGCAVGYEPTSGNFLCPCHGSQFTKTGSIVTGPAALPLQSYPVSKNGNVLTISV